MTMQSGDSIIRQRLTGQARGANRYYRVPPVSSAISAGTSSSPLQVRLRSPGIIVALYGQVQSATDADAATTEFRIQLAGTRDIITDGDSGTFMPFLTAFGKGQQWLPLDIPSVEGLDITVTYRVVTGGNSATPSITFGIFEQR